MNYILDTNVVSELRRKRPDARVGAWFKWADARQLYISVLTLGEMAKGAAQREKYDQAQAAIYFDWLTTVRSHFADRTISVDTHVAEAWGRLAAQRPVAVIDGLIAATALVHGMTLVTRNVLDIADLGLTTLNPWEA